MPDGDVIRVTGKLQKEMMGSITDETWRQLRDIRKRDMLFMVDHVFNINEKDELFKGRIDINSIEPSVCRVFWWENLKQKGS